MSQAVNYMGRILLGFENQELRLQWQVALHESGFRVYFYSSMQEMLELLNSYSFRAVLFDENTYQEFGPGKLPLILANSPASKIFVLGENAPSELNDRVEHDLCAMLCSERPIQDLVKAILSQLESESKPKTEPISEADHCIFKEIGLIGSGAEYQKLCKIIDQVKDVDSTLLIYGESGVGKELVARAIHQLSCRQGERFEAINCAAIPETLLESELFGHKKGAFTDAKDNHEGIFELCSRGVLLLDEIGDMPLSLQAKLLRVLQEKKVFPLGASQSVDIDTRVIAATHRDLIEEVHSGNFREDLYYRISVVPIEVPSLRKRKDDMEILVHHFIDLFNIRFKTQKKYPNKDLMQRFLAYDWPGNIRELRNALERSVILSTDDEIKIEHVFMHLNLHQNSTNKKVTKKHSELIGDDVFDLPLTEARQLFEKIYLEKLLIDCDGNITEVARRCGRYRTDVYRLVERYHIDAKFFRG